MSTAASAAASTRAAAARAAARTDVPHRNEVVLVGRLATVPTLRTLSSGEEVVTFRLDVEPDAADGGGRDTLDCTVAAARTRRAALGWTPGVAIEVTGSVRRRFYRVAGASRPLTVVEVASARRAGAAVMRRRTTG